METAFQHLIPVMQLSSGQRILIYRRLEALARAHALPLLVALLARALEHDRRTRDLEDRWTNRGRSAYVGDVSELDQRVDQMLAGLRDIVTGQVRGLLPHDPQVAVVDRFLARVFPNGLVAITQLPFVDQVAAVEGIVARLGTELAAEVRTLGLDAHVQRLGELTAQYRTAVDRHPAGLSYAAVREARMVGQDYVRQIIALIAGTFFDSNDPAHVSAREAMLAPILEQLEIARARARARRTSRRGGNGQDNGQDEQDGTLDDGDGEDPDSDILDDETGEDEPDGDLGEGDDDLDVPLPGDHTAG